MEEALRERLDNVDARFGGVDARFEQVDARFDKIDARFEQVDSTFSEMYRLIVQEGERTRRHFDVVAEGLEGRIRLGLEGYSELRADVSDLKDGQQRLEAGHLQLDVRMLALESRVTGVEKVQKIVLTEIRGLATRIDRLSPQRRPSRRR